MPKSRRVEVQGLEHSIVEVSLCAWRGAPPRGADAFLERSCREEVRSPRRVQPSLIPWEEEAGSSDQDLPIDGGVVTRGEVTAPETGVDRPVEMRREGRRDGVDTTNGVSYPSADSLASAFCRVI
jgi:hypothetical protein